MHGEREARLIKRNFERAFMKIAARSFARGRRGEYAGFYVEYGEGLTMSKCTFSSEHFEDLKGPVDEEYNGRMQQPGENQDWDEAAPEDPIMVDIERVNARIARYCPHLSQFLAVQDEAVAQVRLFRQSGRRATYLALKKVQKLGDTESGILLEHIFETETQGYVPIFDIQYAWATGNPLGGAEGIARILRSFPTHQNQVRALLYFYGFVEDPPPNMQNVCSSFEPLELRDSFFAIENYRERQKMEEILLGSVESGA